MALYPLGLLAAVAVAIVLGGEESSPALWALVVGPLAVLAAASLLVRRAQRVGR